MPSYVRTRLLQAREFVIGEIDTLKSNHPAFLSEIISDIQSIIGFDYFSFSGVDLDSCRTGTNIILLSNIPQVFIDEYYAEELSRVDPLLASVSEQDKIQTWHNIPPAILAKPEVKKLERLLETYAIPPRTLVSLWNDSGTFYGAAWFMRTEPFSAQELRVLEWFGGKFHEVLTAPILSGFNRQIGVTRTELNCLDKASRGFTSEEIALHLGLATETINGYIKSVVKKLGARNRSQAIADAIRLGLIT